MGSSGVTVIEDNGPYIVFLSRLLPLVVDSDFSLRACQRHCLNSGCLSVSFAVRLADSHQAAGLGVPRLFRGCRSKLRISAYPHNTHRERIDRE